jgi:hypothetical protein
MLGQCIEELAAALLSIAFDMPSVLFSLHLGLNQCYLDWI